MRVNVCLVKSTMGTGKEARWVSCGSLSPSPPRSLSKNGLKTRRWWSGHCFLSAVEERVEARQPLSSLTRSKKVETMPGWNPAQVRELFGSTVGP